MLHGDRMHPAIALDHRRIQQFRQRAGIGGGGHGQDDQFRPQCALQVQHQRQRQIGFQATLMHLIEDDAGNPCQPGIGKQPAGEKTFGNHLDDGGGRGRLFQPGSKADRLADRFMEQARHAHGRGAGGEAARLQHQDLAGNLRPQRKRHQCRLAGARRRHQHGIGPASQALQQRRERIVYRQIEDWQIKHLPAAYHLCAFHAI
jgi:hypothetical protein